MPRAGEPTELLTSAPIPRFSAFDVGPQSIGESQPGDERLQACQYRGLRFCQKKSDVYEGSECH